MLTTILTATFLVAQAAGGAVQSQTQSQAQSVQETTVKPAAPDTGADMTTATFGDWLLRCRQIETGKPAKTCEVVQTVLVQGQTAPFAQLGFGRLGAAEPLYFTAVVPTNIAFPSSLKVALDDKDKAPVEVAWTRCLPGGCFASLAVPADVLTRWRSKEDGGRLIFKNGAGQETAVAISFRGLGRALDALAKEK